MEDMNVVIGLKPDMCKDEFMRLKILIEWNTNLEVTEMYKDQLSLGEEEVIVVILKEKE